MSPVYTPIKNGVFCFFLVELGSHRNHICDKAKFGTLLEPILTFDGQQPISSMFLKKKIENFTISF